MKSAQHTALMASAVLIFAVALQAAEDTDTPEEALSVSVMALSKVAIPVERDVEAKLISPNDTPVSAELAAKVLKIEADVGDEVMEGDVLARLDCRDYDVKLRQATAGISTVKARIVATAARVSAAESRVGVSESRVSVSESRVGAAESRVGAAEFRVGAAESRVGASGSQVSAASSRVNAAVSRVNAATAGIQAATARLQATGTGINAAKSRVNTVKAQATAARARIPSAQAQFKLAQAELNRNRQLRNDKLIPANVLDQAQAAFGSAQSNLSAAQADFAAAQAAVSTANEDINAAAANFQAGKADVESSKANVETVKAELGSSKADLGTAKANMGTTQADVETARADVETTRADVETARADVETARADVETARADLEGAKADLLTVETELENALAQQEAAEVVTERCLVKAPFDGQITQRQFQLGQISAPGMAAFQLLQHHGLEVIARLSPDEVRDQEQGEKVRFVSDGVELDVERRAVVAQVASDSGTQEVRYRVTSKHELPVGKTGRVRWQGKLPAVPPDWLLRREGGLGLMLAVDGKAVFHPLKNAREGQSTLIDLPDNTLLIDANRLRVRNGQKIQQAGE